jgi:hypothetical protein
MQEITAFEQQLNAGAGSPRRARKDVPKEDTKLASDIAEVESILAGLYMDDEEGMDELGMVEEGMDDELGMDELGMDDEEGMLYMDDEPAMDELGMDEEGTSYMDDVLDDEYDEVGMFASEAAPGIEDEITDDHFSEVERVTGDDDIPDAQHTFDVAETNLDHVAGMRAASSRLDRLASYIEGQVVNHGENKQWLKVAYRIDKMADSIDARIKATEEAE